MRSYTQGLRRKMLRETAQFLQKQLGRMRSQWRPDKAPPRPQPAKKADKSGLLRTMLATVPYP